MEDVGKFIVGLMISIAIIVGLTFGGFYINKILKSESVEIDHEIYKDSDGYIDATVNQLSNLKGDFERETNESNKQTYISEIKLILDTFNTDLIENKTLRNFAEDVMEGVYDE